MRYFILALFAALIVAVPVAGAKAVKVTPTYSITAATVSGKNVKFTISVTVTGVPKCTGKVTATRKLSKKKSVSWSARYTGDSAICTAAIHAKLPKSNYGKKLKFAIKFPGNDSIKKFSASKTLKITSPPAPSGPTGPSGGTITPGSVGPQKPGPWYMFNADSSSGDIGMSFTIGPDYKVPGLTRPSGLTMVCDVGGNTSVPFNWSNTFFGMGAQSGTVSSGDNGPNTANMTYSVTWDFPGAHAGTGHFSAAGDFRIALPSTYTHCTTSYDVTFSGGNP